jgi:hypothetical protein
MTAHARQVLGDCRTALRLLEEEKDLQRWRIHWVAALALVWAVGHVLDKMDGSDAAIAAAARAAYKNWKSQSRFYITNEHACFLKHLQRYGEVIAPF